MSWAAGGGSLAQAPDPSHPDELLLVADQPGTLMLTVRVREGMTETRGMKSITAVPDVTGPAPPFTLRLFLHGWGLVAVAVLIVGFAGALDALGNLTSSDFIALVAPLAALLAVTLITRGAGEAGQPPGGRPGPRPAPALTRPPSRPPYPPALTGGPVSRTAGRVGSRSAPPAGTRGVHAGIRARRRVSAAGAADAGGTRGRAPGTGASVGRGVQVGRRARGGLPVRGTAAAAVPQRPGHDPGLPGTGRPGPPGRVPGDGPGRGDRRVRRGPSQLRRPAAADARRGALAPPAGRGPGHLSGLRHHGPGR